ncbi:hypothetical protein [Pengzhenrongella phosphoraccumulans]|uniref:hypothetical protein n=1 Tax=Pengzhenrongella phosphoraccumulans TaxID=3114394 RepID=UPI00388EB77B
MAPEKVARWSALAAVFLGLAGVADLVRWGNRWYISEVFAREARASDGTSWEWVYGLLHSAHEALVRGLVFFLLAAVLAAITVVLRRRLGR